MLLGGGGFDRENINSENRSAFESRVRVVYVRRRVKAGLNRKTAVGLFRISLGRRPSTGKGPTRLLRSPTSGRVECKTKPKCSFGTKAARVEHGSKRP